MIKHGWCRHTYDCHIADWVLKTEQSVIGDSLSYLDMMERNTLEETRRARERQIMEEGM